ncbi:MAG: succinate-semialdehyde dehydrogenase [Solirubrobacterales bacterium]|nr:succinate-semialdehyde dehydrogenase [Solirubrobacterales bacterium]
MATATAAHHYATTNPYTGQTVRAFDTLDAAAVDAAVYRAQDAFDAWRHRPIRERALMMRRAGGLLSERIERFAALITLEMGKRIGESEDEVALSARILTWYGEHGPAIAAPRPLSTDAGEATLVTEPLGPLLGIEPWNYPIYQVVRFVGPNLVLGNTVLLKHAGSCPQTALALEELFHDAGAPEGVYANLFVETDDIGRIIDSPFVHGTSLTGSERAGAAVAEMAGRAVVKSVLELGGSDPFIVLDGERMERTVEAATIGRLGNMGQSCVASKRFIVLDDFYDAFLSGLRERFAGLQPGDPADPATTMAPLSSERTVETLMEQVGDAVDKGARVVVGGGRPDRPGAFFEPTILTDVTPDMRPYHEELFGPVAVVYRVRTEDEAVVLANDTPFGLGGSVFCTDLERARRVADRVDSGMVWINQPTASRPELPFGGIKRSGYGRELSDLGMFEFANRKLICAVPSDAPIRGLAG